MWMIVLDALGHVDYVDLVFKQTFQINKKIKIEFLFINYILKNVIQHIKLAQIGVHEFGLVVEAMNYTQTVEIELASERLVDLSVLEERRREAVLPDECHHEHVTPQMNRLGTFNSHF